MAFQVFLSGLKMKALQPQIEQLKSKYGTDKSKSDQMNRELIDLYRTNKVNPAGSCLPMLLQLPIFIGLYSALSHSIDLYQSPFYGWITDLSWKDPYYVFPALWTASLLVYVWINPQQPQQPGMPDMKWIMIGMNVFFGWLSKDWPAGLTLYLFISNLLGILQQLMLKRGQQLKIVQEGA
jgi:YidC/Oxa1 family membrane protein insertase